MIYQSKQAKPQNTSNWTCPECGGTKTQYSLKIIPAGRGEGGLRFPKFVPQFKEVCQKCFRYRRFAPQSSILVKRFNDRLTALTLPAKGRDFYEE